MPLTAQEDLQPGGTGILLTASPAAQVHSYTLALPVRTTQV